MSKMDSVIKTTMQIQSQLPLDAPFIPNLFWPHFLEGPVIEYTLPVQHVVNKFTLLS